MTNNLEAYLALDRRVNPAGGYCLYTLKRLREELGNNTLEWCEHLFHWDLIALWYCKPGEIRSLLNYEPHYCSKRAPGEVRKWTRHATMRSAFEPYAHSNQPVIVFTGSMFDEVTPSTSHSG